jgi:hypothetical protein
MLVLDLPNSPSSRRHVVTTAYNRLKISGVKWRQMGTDPGSCHGIESLKTQSDQGGCFVGRHNAVAITLNVGTLPKTCPCVVSFIRRRIDCATPGSSKTVDSTKYRERDRPLTTYTDFNHIDMVCKSLPLVESES